MSNELTRRRIKNFEKNFGTGELHLAYHAALPVVLNAELVHLLRVNFLLDPSYSLSYTSEAKLLLSPLCQELGEGLYEIDPDIRLLLLEELATKYGEQRIREVATLLWQYTAHASPWQGWGRLQRTQQLTALSFLNRQKAIEWMNETEIKLGETEEEHKKWLIAMRKDLEQNILSIRPAQQKIAKVQENTIRNFLYKIMKQIVPKYQPPWPFPSRQLLRFSLSRRSQQPRPPYSDMSSS